MTGKLAVQIKSESAFLENNMPIEIRDSKHGLVDTMRSGQTIELEEGLYSVSAAIERGDRITKHVHVKSGDTKRVEFDAPSMPRELKGEPAAWTDASEHTSRGIYTLDNWAAFAHKVVMKPQLDAGTFQVGDADTALRYGIVAPQTLRIELQHATEAPVWIAITVGGQHVWMALPLSDHDRCHACTLDVAHLKIHLEQRRRVGATLCGLMEGGKISLGLELARTAADQLLEKYSDPTLAAYGGLVLHRFGMLDKYTGWIENLSRDFAWLPDGRMLMASLLSRSSVEKDRKRGLDLLLENTELVTVFSEAFSLALSLLRRWPDKSGEEARSKRLTELAPAVARFDFSSTFSTARWPK